MTFPYVLYRDEGDVCVVVEGDYEAGEADDQYGPGCDPAFMIFSVRDEETSELVAVTQEEEDDIMEAGLRKCLAYYERD